MQTWRMWRSSALADEWVRMRDDDEDEPDVILVPIEEIERLREAALEAAHQIGSVAHNLRLDLVSTETCADGLDQIASELEHGIRHAQEPEQ